MSLDAGRRLGTFEIESPLGAGGMGEVYRARDTKLNRPVAIKVLPQELASDPERLKRFEQEARAASALDHPNIITIHDIRLRRLSVEASAKAEGFGGQVTEGENYSFIVMQYVEGKTLRELLKEGPLDLNRTLDYGAQITDGLSRAHDKGIVHRDLKPANLMVTEDGLVKILDFGLAKLAEPGDLTEASTKDVDLHTKEGHVLGTAPYMSPEQAQGKKVDSRSDIFSFGCVLYEMVTGQRAFPEDSMAGVMASIIRGEPRKVSEIVPSVPLDLERITTRCLRKEPERRFQSMGDLRVELLEIQETVKSGSFVSSELVQKARPGQSRKTWLAIAAGVALVGLAVTAWILTRGRPVDDTPPRTTPFTTSVDLERDPAISPDGKSIAYAWNRGGEFDNEKFDIYVQLVGGGEPLQLTKSPLPDMSPAWSPDGTKIAFLREVEGGSEIFVVSSLGGEERRLGKTLTKMWYGGATWSAGLDWSPDGNWLAVSDRDSAEDDAAIFLVSTESGDKRRVTTPETGAPHHQPAFSPDGEQLAFLRGQGFANNAVCLYELESGEQKVLFEIPNGALYDVDWAAEESSLLVSHEINGRIAMGKVSLDGEFFPLNVGENAETFDVGKVGGLLAYSTRFLANCNIWRMDGPAITERGEPEQWIPSTQMDWLPDLSPDGSKIAFTSRRSGSPAVWVCNSEGLDCSQLAGEGLVPRWSPDSEFLSFNANGNSGLPAIFVVEVGSGFQRQLTDDTHRSSGASWSHDGDWIYYHSGQGGRREIWKIPSQGGEPTRLTYDGGRHPLESSDGQFVYYLKPIDPHEERPLKHHIWKVPVDGGEETSVYEKREIGNLYWTLWNDQLIIHDGDYKTGIVIRSVDLTTGEESILADLGTERRYCFGLDVSSDGRWMFFSGRMGKPESDIMLVENFR